MAIVDAVGNLTEVIYVLSPEIARSVGGLITILKAVGVIAIVYIIYVVVMGVLDFRSRRRMKVIEKKVNVIDKKLDRLLKFKKK